MPKSWIALLVGGASLLPIAVPAKDNPLLNEPGDRPFYEHGVEYDEVGPWEEKDFTLPPYPDDGDLIEFPPGSAPDRFTYYVDEKHFQVTPDKVVHYTVVAESDTGARNVFFEGIRCDEALYKIYGYGTSDGKVREPRKPKWKPISTSRAQRYRYDMHRLFFCDTYGFPVTRERAMEHLKNGTTIEDTRKVLGGEKSGW